MFRKISRKFPCIHTANTLLTASRNNSACEPLEMRRLYSASLTTLTAFGSSDGANPGGLLLSDGVLYGTASTGGANNVGTVFSIPVTGGAPTTLATFGGALNSGIDPEGGLVLIGDTLYGTTSDGGAFTHGTIFSIPISGGTPTILTSFGGPLGNSGGTDGEFPTGTLVLSGNTFYGTTEGGGEDPSGNYGTVFSVPVTGGTPTTLASFTRDQANTPFGGVILSGNTLYGTTYLGGANDDGCVFSLPITGGTPVTLASFDGTDGDGPVGPLTLVGQTLYGTTPADANAGMYGDVFSVPVTGGSPTDVVSFTSTGPYDPQPSLILVGDTLYGTTNQGGGAPNEGTLFSLPDTGGSATNLLSFDTSNGTQPSILTSDSSGNLYGATQVYNTTTDGTVFEISTSASTNTIDHLAFSAQPTNVATGQSITPAIQVTVTNSSGGTVTTDNSNITLALNSGTLTGTATVAAVNGVATFSNLSIGTAGTYTLNATDGSLTPATSDSFVVSGGLHSLTFLGASTNSIPLGGSVTFDATVGGTSTTPTGTITFLDNGTPIGTGSLDGFASATFTTTSLPAGSQSITAAYGGDTIYSPSTSAANVVVVSGTTGGGGTVSSGTGLVPTILSDTVPSTIVAGQPIHGALKLKLTNSLATPEKGYTVNIFASATATLDPTTATPVTSLKEKGTVKAGKSATLSVPIKDLPTTLASGSYYLIAQTVDSAGNAPYAATTSTVTVAAPYVALSATASVVKPATIAVNKPGSLVIDITNTGNINATGSLVITLSPSSDGTTPLPGITLATTTVHPTLKPGKSGKYTVHFKVPASLSSGLYFPYAVISQDGVSTTVIGTSQFTAG